MKLNGLLSSVCLMCGIISTYVMDSTSVDAQRSLLRSTRDRTQYLLVGAKPECNFACKKSKRRKFCGTDGRTYNTDCAARRAKCADPMLTTKPGKCKEATCLQARNYKLRKAQVMSRHSVHIPTCMEDGRYAPRQCHTNMGYCWCVMPDGRMVAESAVENSEPSCNTGNVRRSTESCPTTKRTALLASIRSRSVREYRKATPLAEVPSSSNEILRLGLAWKFSTLDKNKNGNMNSKELRLLLKKHHARECENAFTGLCDIDTDQQISNPEWMACLFTPLETPRSSDSAVPATTPSIETLHVPHSTFMPVSRTHCHNDDQTTLIDKVRNLILKERRQASVPPAPVTEEGRENNSVLWKFSQLDANGNGEISAKEIKSLRRKFRKDNFKECFLGVCDVNDDKSISESEWDTCFTAHKRKTCINERREALQLQRAQAGVYVPECDADDPRYFNQVQCHAGTGYCWCTLRDTGRPIPATSTRGRPTCGGTQPTTTSTAITLPGCSKPDVFMDSLRKALTKEMNHHSRSDSAAASAVDSQQFTEEVASFFFSFLDANDDNVLSNKEAKMFRKKLRRKVTPKRCLKKFMRFCDENRNKKVTLQEFSTCLQLGYDLSTESLSHPDGLPILEEN